MSVFEHLRKPLPAVRPQAAVDPINGRRTFTQRGDTPIVLLRGSDKDDEDRDIARAHAVTKAVSR